MGNAGRVLMIPKGDYNPATPYEMLDCVYYNGRSYVCKQASTGHAPTDTTYWQPMTPDVSAEIQALTNQVNGNWSEGGKNLFKVTASSQTLGSIVFTVNADGTVSAVGASGDSYRQLNLGTITGIGGAVKLVGCPSGGVIGQTYVVSMKNETTNTWLSPVDTGDGQQYTLVENNTYSVNIIVYANNTVNLLFKPMISKDLSVTYADYQPYAKTNVELTEDTTAKIITFTPTDSSKADLDWGEFVKVGNLVMGTVAFTVKNVTAGTEISLGTLPYQPVNAKAIPVVNTYGRNEFAGYISILGNTNTLKYLPAETVIQGRICGTLIFLIK